LPMAFSMLAGVVFGADLRAMFVNYADAVPAQGAADQNLAPDLVQLIAFAVSTSAGCRYCQAHTSLKFVDAGAAAHKLSNILRYDESELFSPAEKSLVALALAAGQTPNEVNAAHFEALRRHFSERQIVQIVAVIGLFGFLNRWNDTMATTLETKPVDFASDALAASGWNVSKHGKRL